MSYDFGNLSPADFEDLVRDLVGRELGVRFEAFAAGPDGGMDGRHARGAAAAILQAKHYGRSSYASLKSKLKHTFAQPSATRGSKLVVQTRRQRAPFISVANAMCP